MSEYRVKNWEKFQHYKDRKPPWIKLYRSLQEDYEFMSLPLASMALAMHLWLFASEDNKGVIPLTGEEIAWRLHISIEEFNDLIKPLISRKFIQPCKHHASTVLASPSIKIKEKQRTEKTMSKPTGSDPPVIPPKKKPHQLESKEDKEALFAYWVDRCQMGPPEPKFTTARRRLLDGRLDEGYSLEDLAEAIDGCAANPHNQGHNDRSTKYMNWELILRNAEKVDYFIQCKRGGKR